VGSRFHDLRRVISNLGVFDFQTPDGAMRLVSVHPGVTVDEVVEQTSFELAMADEVGESRLPTDEELKIMREFLDPEDFMSREVS